MHLKDDGLLELINLVACHIGLHNLFVTQARYATQKKFNVKRVNPHCFLRLKKKT